MFIYLLKKMKYMNPTSSKKSLKELTKTAKTLRIIAHPVRLQILQSLESESSLTVSAINKSISTTIEQSMLSHHLIKMKDNGILRSKKIGKFNHYSILNKDFMAILNK